MEEIHLTNREMKVRQKKRTAEMKQVLINAIRMQALYSNGKIKIVETSSRVN